MTVLEENGTKSAVLRPFEIKSRVAPATDQHEQARKEKYNLGTLNFVKLNNSKVFDYIEHNKERTQLLHHCIVCGINVCYLVIGNSNGEVIYSIGLEVMEKLVNSYEEILDDVYNDVLKCFFEKDVNEGLNHLTNEENDRLIKAVEANKDQISNKWTFEDRLYLYRAMTHQNDVPVPKSNQLIPFFCSYWNKVKPGKEQGLFYQLYKFTDCGK